MCELTFFWTQPRRSDDFSTAQFGDLLLAVTQLRQHFVGVLAQQRGSGNLRREAGELDRAADRKVAAALLLLHLDHGAAGAQGRIVGNFLHGKHRRAWHLELAQHVDRLELGLVGQPRLDLCKDIEDVRLARAGGGVGRICRPFWLPDRLAGLRPVLLLDREVDVGVRVGFPALALEYPARLPAAACVSAAGDRIGELPVRILRVFLQIANMVQAFLVPQLDAAQIQHRILHGHSHFLAFAGLPTADQCGQDADREMHAGVAVAERRSADRRRTVPKTGRRGGAARALRHVFINLEVRIGRAFAEALDRPEDDPRVEFLNVLPGEPHPVHRARREVLDQHVGLADQLLQDRLAFGRLGVQLQRPLVAVEHREIQRVQIGDVTQLIARDVSNAWPLDFQYIGAEPRQQLRTRWSSLHAREVDNFDSFEWQLHDQTLLISMMSRPENGPSGHTTEDDTYKTSSYL